MITPTLNEEKLLWNLGYLRIAGLDEVGRGCFAGSVVVGAVVLSKDSKLPEGIRDSKLLTPKKRKTLDPQIKNSVLDWSLGESSVEEINNLGISKATQIAFSRAINNLKKKPDFLLIDAFYNMSVANISSSAYIDGIDHNIQKPIIHGDALCLSIAAASIIAKVYRDELMEKLHEQYPQYNFAKHKGYGTKEHRDAIKKHGLSPLHRTSFKLDKYL